MGAAARAWLSGVSLADRADITSCRGEQNKQKGRPAALNTTAFSVWQCTK
jgi:hypothetical protein